MPCKKTDQVLELEGGQGPGRVADVLWRELLEGLVGVLCQGCQALGRWRHIQCCERPAEVCLHR